MQIIVLIACASQKQSYRSKARKLYISPLFKKNLAYAESLGSDAICILSAQHGLVDIDDELDPYDRTLNTLPAAEVRAWSSLTLRHLASRFDLKNDHFVILAGQQYRKYLVPHLASCDVPMVGMGIGQQLQWLNNQTALNQGENHG